MQIKEVLVNDENWRSYFDIEWRQWPNTNNGFTLTFQKKNLDSLIKLRPFEVSFKEEVLNQFFANKKVLPQTISYPGTDGIIKLRMGSKKIQDLMIARLSLSIYRV